MYSTSCPQRFHEVVQAAYDTSSNDNGRPRRSRGSTHWNSAFSHLVDLIYAIVPQLESTGFWQIYEKARGKWRYRKGPKAPLSAREQRHLVISFESVLHPEFRCWLRNAGGLAISRVQDRLRELQERFLPVSMEDRERFWITSHFQMARHTF